MIYFVERNIHGAWVVYGIDGVKQYYGYTKAEARRKYLAELWRVCEEELNLRGEQEWLS